MPHITSHGCPIVQQQTVTGSLRGEKKSSPSASTPPTVASSLRKAGVVRAIGSCDDAVTVTVRGETWVAGVDTQPGSLVDTQICTSESMPKLFEMLFSFNSSTDRFCFFGSRPQPPTSLRREDWCDDDDEQPDSVT